MGAIGSGPTGSLLEAPETSQLILHAQLLWKERLPLDEGKSDGIILL